jgi:hypothetical protein
VPDAKSTLLWIPAFAGMTNWVGIDIRQSLSYPVTIQYLEEKHTEKQ